VDLHYLASLVSLVLFDPRIPLDDRILSTAYASAVPLLAAGAAGLWRTNRPALRGLVVAAVLSLGGVHGFQLASTVQVLREDGQGYAASRWRSSPVMEILREQKPAIVYTNEIPAVYFNAGLTCSIPVRDDDWRWRRCGFFARLEQSCGLFGRVSPSTFRKRTVPGFRQVAILGRQHTPAEDPSAVGALSSPMECLCGRTGPASPGMDEVLELKLEGGSP
jgi:hypothetical protein